MGNPRYANGARRRAIRDRWRAIGAPCGICHHPIDYSLGMVTYYTEDPETGERIAHRKPHPMSFVVDEIVPVSKGGDPLDFANTRPAHWVCNARRGDGTRSNKNIGGPLPQPFDEW
ncbi:MAG: HNH endonuclease [Atopobiaceae bacterium]|nr:HNH endonuclease [Atopobiaceae bacterium]